MFHDLSKSFKNDIGLIEENAVKVGTINQQEEIKLVILILL
jgi:hypothetical protein